MSPVRLLVLGILLYILYRLLFGGKKKRAATSRGQNRGIRHPAHDVLVEDPVCHTYVPKAQAVVAKQGEKSYFFCSEKCREIFLTEKGEAL